MKRIRLDTEGISDWNSFHEQFQELLGFPAFYGRNMGDEPDTGMSSLTLESGEQLVIELDGVEDFRERCPEQLEALIDCTAAVNRRFVEGGNGSSVVILFR